MSNTMPKVSARDKILRSAHDLFYQNGIRATGIDKIISTASVTKVTFYRHFPSKNDLILEFLEYRHQRWITWFNEALERHGAKPGKGLAPLSPTLAEWFCSPTFRGCAFINSVAELGTSDDVVKMSKNHKRNMTNIIANLLPNTKQRKNIANAVSIAVDGAIFKAQLEPTKQKQKATLRGLEVLLAGLKQN